MKIYSIPLNNIKVCHRIKSISLNYFEKKVVIIIGPIGQTAAANEEIINLTRRRSSSKIKNENKKIKLRITTLESSSQTNTDQNQSTNTPEESWTTDENRVVRFNQRARWLVPRPDYQIGSSTHNGQVVPGILGRF